MSGRTNAKALQDKKLSAGQALLKGPTAPHVALDVPKLSLPRAGIVNIQDHLTKQHLRSAREGQGVLSMQ